MTQSLMHQARARIIEMIFSGDLKSGDALHEAELSERLSMSRTPVREAFKRMECEGMLAREGRFLRLRMVDAAEVEEIFLLRAAIETETARAAVHLPRSVFEDMTARIRAFMASGPGEGEDEWSIDDAFHRMMARATNNPILLHTLDGLRLRTYVFDRSRVPERFLLGCEEHLTILDALRDGDGDKAAHLMLMHLAHARDAILSCLERTPGAEKIS
jgi:DNA-binding GntR family transcriptional regulator